MTALPAPAGQPSSIAWFERLGLVVLALVLLQNVLAALRRFAQDPGAAYAEIGLSALFLTILLLLILDVSRRRSRKARWALLVTALLTAAATLASATFRWDAEFFSILPGASAALWTIAVALTFTPSARRWLAERKA